MKIYLWAQRLENDGNDYVYVSDVHATMSPIEDFTRKTDVIYESSKILDKKHERNAVEVTNASIYVKMYHDGSPVKKIFISLTIGIDQAGRQSPAFVFLEDANGINVTDNLTPDIINHILTIFAEKIGRVFDAESQKAVKSAYEKMVLIISKKKLGTQLVIVTVTGIIILLIAAIIFRECSR